jgi:hypothetical protein
MSNYVLSYITQYQMDSPTMIEMSTVTVIILPDGRMDRRNAALYCGISEKTLAMHACRGTGPEFVKRGKVWYFKEALDRWILSGKGQKRA